MKSKLDEIFAFLFAEVILFFICYFSLSYFFHSKYDLIISIALIAVSIWGYILDNKERSKIKEYFLCYEVGTIDDINKNTSIETDIVIKKMNEFLKDDLIEILLDKPYLFKWKENRNFPKGMITNYISLDL